MRSVSPLFF
jgi:hypothetical protein